MPEKMPEKADNIFDVTQITSYIGKLITSDKTLQNVSVQGELSNFKAHSSGHLYFTLKDANAQLKCAMFRSSAEKLRFTPQNGMKLVCRGRIDLYARDGAYQLIASEMTPAGIGDLNAEFERLKAELNERGYFDEAHKKKIPFAPSKIAIVTSPTGAAIRDMIRILGARWPLSKILLLPVRVQGDEAPLEIAGAIKYANIHKAADVIITGRGGGSREDLWAFNTERVAKAIYDSEIPVISAVGHEPDVLISDYVADLRASTPSNAAELAVPDIAEFFEYLYAAERRLTGDIERVVAHAKQWLDSIAGRKVILSPQAYLSDRSGDVKRLAETLVTRTDRTLSKSRARLEALEASLSALSPLGVLGRGYAIVRNESGAVVRSVGGVNTGDKIKITVSDGDISAGIL